MSEDQQREEKAKLLLEWNDNKQELERLRARAARISDILLHVGNKLASEPEKLIFSGESTPSRYMSRDLIVDTSGLDLGAIIEVRDAIRALTSRQQDLQPRLAAFGLPTK